MCYDLEARPPIPPISGGATDSEDIVLSAKDGNRFAATLAHPKKPGNAQVIIFPDVRGLHTFYKELALRFAEQGIRALAIDYFGRSAGLSARDEKFEYAPHVEKMTMPTFLNDVAAAMDYMAGDGKKRATFVVGFCRGGTLSLLTAAEGVELAGVVAFYAGLSRPVPGAKGGTLEQASKIRCPVLGLFGGADTSIPTEERKRLDDQLAVAGVKHEIIAYAGAPHSFFDRRNTEFAEASADAWKRIFGFIADLAPIV